MGDFTLGNMRHRVVVGLDYFQRQLTDNSTGDVWIHDVTPQGEINYEDPFTGATAEPRYLSQQSVDQLLASAAKSNSNVKDATYSAYFSDVINITPQLLAMASLRIDHFDTEGDITTDADDYDQTALSPKFGLLYQVLPDRLSVFANYMNGFKNVAPGRHYTSTDPNAPDFYIETFKPEHANQVEFGIKTNLFSDKLISSVSFYNIRVDDKLMDDPENARNQIQGAEIESQGFEIEITANPVPGLNIITGYSYNDAQVLEGGTNTWLEKGKRPGESGAKNLFNAWATYRMTSGALEGFGIGFGANYASELIVLDSKITGRFVLPAYTVLNSSLFYDHSDFRIAVNVNNLTDKEYYKGYSTIDPQKPRNVSASFTYKF
jgi:iron complex outermembrane receptor protein